MQKFLIFITFGIAVVNAETNITNKTTIKDNHNETVTNNSTEDVSPKLKLFDCKQSKILGVYAPQTIDSCDNLNNDATEVNVKDHKIFKFQPKTTHFFTYICRAIEVKENCNGKSRVKNGNARNWKSSTYLPVNPIQCDQWIRQAIFGDTNNVDMSFPYKFQSYGSTYRVRTLIPPVVRRKDDKGIWYPDTCPVGKILWHYFYEFEIQTAYITGSDSKLQMSYFANTSCGNMNTESDFGTVIKLEAGKEPKNTGIKYVPPMPAAYCTPVYNNTEDTTTLILYYQLKHDNHDFQLMKVLPVLQAENFISIPELGLAGHVSAAYEWREDKLAQKTFYKSEHFSIKHLLEPYIIQIDNGFVVTSKELPPETKIHSLTKVRKFATKASTTSTLPIVQGHIVNALINHKHHLLEEMRRTCNLQAGQNKLYHWITNHFPSAANEWIRSGQNVIVKPMGDAIMLKECMEIKEAVEIWWSRQYNNTCYLHFPIRRISNGSGTEEQKDSVNGTHSQDSPFSEFLVLSTRQVVNESPTISCARRDALFVVDNEQSSFRISRNGTIRKTQSLLKSLEDFQSQDVIQDIIGDHEDIILEEKFHLPPVTISEIMSRVYGAVSELAEITEEVARMKANQETPHKPDILTAITYGLGNFLSESPSQVISALGKGLTDTVKAVGGAGSELIHAVGDAGSELIDSAAEGIAKIFNKWVMMGLIIVVGLILLFLLFKYRSELQAKGVTGNNVEMSNITTPANHDIKSDLVLMGIIQEYVRKEVERYISSMPGTSQNATERKKKEKQSKQIPKDQPPELPPRSLKSRRGNRRKQEENLANHVSAVKHIINGSTNDGMLVTATALLGNMPIKLEALIDTGSPISFIKKEMWDQCNVEPFMMTDDIRDFGTVKSITGSTVEIVGSTILPLAIGSQSWLHEVYLSSNVEFNLVLGLDFLKRIKAVVNLPNENIQTKKGMARVNPSKFKHPKLFVKGPFVYNKSIKKLMIGLLSLWLVTVAAMTMRIAMTTTNETPTTTVTKETSAMACSNLKTIDMNSTKYSTGITTIGARSGRVIASNTQAISIMEVNIPDILQKNFNFGEVLKVTWISEPNISTRTSIKCRHRIYKKENP